MAEGVADVWDRSKQFKIVLQKGHTVEYVVRKYTRSGRAGVKNVYEVISGEIIQLIRKEH